MSSKARFQVAFICTGNRFRSPLAAAVLADVAVDVAVHVVSAGVLELRGAEALPEAVELGRRFGVDLSAHRAQAVTALELEPFDLVIGFERSHVHTAVVDAGARVEVTYTLPELVELLQAVPELAYSAHVVDQARARVAQAHAGRAPDFRTAGVPEIHDPLGRSSVEQRRIANAIRDLTARVADLLFR